VLGKRASQVFVRFAAVEPDNRRNHHLPHWRQRLVGAAPLGHRSGIHLIRAVIHSTRTNVDAIDGPVWHAREEGVELNRAITSSRCAANADARLELSMSAPQTAANARISRPSIAGNFVTTLTRRNVGNRPRAKVGEATAIATTATGPEVW